MVEYLTASENIAFLVALTLFLLLFVVELLSVLLGLEVFNFMDELVPEVDLDAGAASPGFLDSVLSFLRIGRVPMSMTITVFLFVFAFIGYNLQHILWSVGIGHIHWLLASGVAFIGSMPFVRFGNTVLEKVLPRDESAAFSSDEYVGRVAEITLGVATHAKQTEAKLVGPDNKIHHIQVVADKESDSFASGAHVLVVGRRAEGIFTVIEIQNPLLES